MLYMCLDESQVVKGKETLPEYGDHISNEDKVLNENRDGDNSLENPESVLGEVKGNYFTLIFNDTFKSSLKI